MRDKAGPDCLPTGLASKRYSNSHVEAGSGGEEGGRGEGRVLVMFPIWLAGRFVLNLPFDSVFFFSLARKDGERRGGERAFGSPGRPGGLTLRCTLSVPSKVKAVRFGVSEIS